MQRSRKFAAVMVCMTLLSGCSMFNEKNRVLLNKLDKAAEDTVLTDNKVVRVAAAPLAVPVGLTAGAIDILIIHPASELKPSYQNTKEMIWEKPEGSDFRQAVLFLPKVVATPLVFVTAWTFRSFFD